MELKLKYDQKNSHSYTDIVKTISEAIASQDESLLTRLNIEVTKDSLTKSWEAKITTYTTK